MRSMLFMSCWLLASFGSAPALAHEPVNKAGEIARKLDDPMTQYAVAGMLSAMSKAVLEMRIEPLVKAAGDLGGGGRVANLPPNATVADLAGTDHANVRDEIVRQVPRAMSAMGAMAGALEKMVPEVERTARVLRETTPPL